MWEGSSLPTSKRFDSAWHLASESFHDARTEYRDQRHIFLKCRREDDPENAVDLNALTVYEDKNMGSFRRIYPQDNEEKYQNFFENSCSLFQETAASKARSECARIQREEIKQKNHEIEMMRKKNCGKKVSMDAVRPESPRSSKKGPPNRGNCVRYKKTEHVS